MKRFLVIVVVLFMIAATGAFAQSYNFSDFQKAFQDFAGGMAGALPLDASVGLNWSDAYIGNFPHFGIGLTVGAATIPFGPVDKALTAFGRSVPSNLGFLSSIGIPIPAYTVDARIGGFILPFDIGVKFGYLPQDSLKSFGITKFKLDYLLLGFDVRYALIQDKGASPGLSVGLGYTYMRGEASLPGVFGGGVTVASVQFPDGTTHDLGFTDPNLDFIWSTSVIDAKIQISKNLFIITPYAGAGLAYGISNAGGGMSANMTVDSNPPTQQQIDAINQATGSNYSLTNPGYAIKAGANGFSARVFGGMSFNILILKLGLGVSYEFFSGSFAGMMNARIQF